MAEQGRLAVLPWLCHPDMSRLRALDPVRAGLVLNQVAVPEVLDGLVRVPGLAWAFIIRAGLLAEPVPARWAAELARNRDGEIRAAVACSPFVPVDVRARLAGDSDPAVRLAAAARAWSNQTSRHQETFGPPLPDTVYETLATDPDPQVRATLARNPDVRGQTRVTLARDEDQQVRQAASCGPLPLKELLWLLADPDALVRDATRWHWSEHKSVLAPASILRRYLPVVGGRWAELAAFVELTPELLSELMADPTTHVALASNPSLPEEALLTLADSQDTEVLRVIVFRPGLPRHLYDRIGHDPEGWAIIGWLRPNRASLTTRLSYMDNPKRIIRRTLAIGPDLPADAVRRLASDDDFIVRLLLCECHPDAPGETLTEVAATWRRASWPHLVRHKNFPPTALPPYARSKHAHERAAVADRPGLPAELVQVLLDDQHTRSAAASNPTLPPNLLRGLLDDPDPLVRLGAARNPALSPDVQHQLASGSLP